MSLVHVQEVTKQFGAEIVLCGASLDLHAGNTVAMVGPNGAGKTTLLRIIAGQLEPDSGTVVRARQLSVGYLAQEPQLDSTRTLADEVRAGLDHLHEMESRMQRLSESIATAEDELETSTLMAQYDRLQAGFTAGGGYTTEQRVGEVLSGLGFATDDLAKPIGQLSGGQQCRAALARLLLSDPDLLLLDEPTNHLDIDAVRWLERFLAAHRGAALIISHDRYLLDRAADGIIEVEHGRAKHYRGNYTTYTQSKATERLTRARRYAQDRAFIEKERAFIAKHMAGQRTKEAQGRRTRLERRIAAGEFVLEAPNAARDMTFAFDGVPMESGNVLRVEQLSKGFGNVSLFEALNLQVQAGQRLGITGPNGVGKTTLLRILLAELAADAGWFEWDRQAAIGYYAQNVDELDPEDTPIASICAVREELNEQRVRDLLAVFQFFGEGVFKRLGDLSGGEQSRVRLLRMLLRPANVLVLDEPTNHLDIASREALEEALVTFPGTVIAVSHDRYFLDRVCDHLLVMRPEQIERIAGNYTTWREQAESAVYATVNPAIRKDASSARSVAKRESAAPTPARRTAEFDLLSVDAIEALLAEQEQRVQAVQARFADPENYKDADAVKAIREQLAGEKERLALIEEAWLERLESASE